MAQPAPTVSTQPQPDGDAAPPPFDALVVDGSLPKVRVRLLPARDALPKPPVPPDVLTDLQCEV